jgi:hypothetical protein
MRKLVLFLFLLLSYFATGYNEMLDKQIAILLFWGSALFMIGFFDFVERFIEKGEEQPRQKIIVRREIFTSFLCSIAFFCALVVGWDKIRFLSDNFDPGTLLFISFAPAIILLDLKIDEIARMAAVSLLITPFLITIKLYYIAEIAAIITYIFFAVCTLQFFMEEQWNKKRIFS